MKLLIYLSTFSFQTLTFAQTGVIIYKIPGQDVMAPSITTKSEIGQHKESYSISITVTNIRNHEGVIRFKFFDDATPFPHKRGFLRVVVPKSQITGDSLTMTCNGFISKNMGIALLDDENNNWELDFGWFLPREGHAFSDYYHTALRRPVYQDFSFLLTGNKKVVMKMKYY